MKQPKICGIYKITSPIGKIYIGKAKDIKGRWSSHKSNKSKSIRLLYESFEVYGANNHKFEIVEKCEVVELIEKEKYWVAFYDTYKTTHGLNLSKGGSGCSEWSEETRKKSIGRVNSMQGRKHTKESIAKMSESVKQKYKEGYVSPTVGMIHTEDAKLRMGMNKRGEKNWGYGRTMPQETRDKLRAKMTGLKRSNETKKKISEAKKGSGLGRKASIESRMKMSVAQKGKKLGYKMSDESKLKMRYSNLKRPATGASKYKGVRGFQYGSTIINGIKTYSKWYATITINRKPIYLGVYKTKEEAAFVYNQASKKYHGEFANLNIITE